MPIRKPPKECLEVNTVGLTAPALTLRGPIPSRVAEESNAVYGKPGGVCVWIPARPSLCWASSFSAPCY